jgi:hypothetical protein
VQHDAFGLALLGWLSSAANRGSIQRLPCRAAADSLAAVARLPDQSQAPIALCTGVIGAFFGT